MVAEDYGVRIALALMALLMIPGALGLSVAAPDAVQEGMPLSISATGAGTVTISLHGTIVASGAGTASYTLATNASSAGLYEFRFSDAAQNSSRTIEIINVPLTVTPTAPEDDELAATQATFALTANWAPELCYVTIDGASNTLAAISPTAFRKTLAVSDGIHTVQYKCKLGDELASTERTIIVDTTAPAVLASTPAGEVTGPYVTITIDTDEIAVCRYGQQDVPYEDLASSMGETYALRNAVTLPLSGGPQTYFVRCQDVHGNRMAAPAIVSFLGRVAPTARISIEGDGPVKAGTHRLTLKTSAPLAAAPSLSYTLQQGGKTQQIGLTGKDDSWSGYIAIPEGMEDTAVFSYEGKTPDGVIGREIESGRVLTVDTMPPPAVDGLALTHEQGGLRLRWHVRNPEQGVTYHVYRGSSEAVGYADHYATTKSTTYLDTAAHGQQHYYYRVAPVDEAGNIGPLSVEVYGDGVMEERPADPALLARLDEELLLLSASLLDANQTIGMLEREQSPEIVSIIADMRLAEQARAVRSQLESQAARLRELRAGAPAATEADAAIADARAAREAARHSLIARITPLHHAETVQAADLRGLEQNLPFMTVGQPLSAEEREAYLADAASLQQRLTITLEARSFTLHDRSGNQREYTHVRKRVALDAPANDLTVIEVIPKAVAQDVDEIAFENPPTVLERDPVVEYRFPVLQQEEYSYVLSRIVPLDHIKASRTFVYPRLPSEAPAPSAAPSPLTGFAIGSGPTVSGSFLLMLFGALLIAGLGLYYVSLTASTAPKKAPPPLRAAPVRTIVPQPLPKEPSAAELLVEAERCIDRKEYLLALDAYKRAAAVLEGDATLRQQFQREILQVYDKLLLHRRLDEVGAALEHKDAAAAKAALAQAQQLAARIGEQPTPLIEDAKSAYRRFSQAINALEIERAGRY